MVVIKLPACAAVPGHLESRVWQRHQRSLFPLPSHTRT